MEFSLETSSSLRMLGDDSKIDEESFKAILSETIQDLMGNVDLPSTATGLSGTNTACDGDRVEKTVASLDMCRPVIRSKLASTGTYPPHVIDVDWKLNYRVRSSTGEEGGGAMYLITLHTEEADGQQGKVTFSCSLSQLTHLVTSLRQASRCIQKYASNS
ncbi:COMM domain-containing protein 3-like isoform X2 [Macrobrachium nipponense]|uniref:COMM domain-containing protein 3-like isoform X2 n=1 Tax=Macrobrachium nipponense TaxID=159736 RepID=UPI0030C7EB85